MSDEMMTVLQSILHGDTNWRYHKATSLPHRGISDYRRTVMFTRKLTSEEREAVRKHLDSLEKPGWTEVQFQGYQEYKGEHHYTFHTCWDSSD